MRFLTRAISDFILHLHAWPPSPISTPRRIFEKSPHWWPKVDFDRVMIYRWGTSKLFSTCSFELFWPPPSVVSTWVTLQEISIFANFGLYERSWGFPQYGLTPPLSTRYTHCRSDKSNHGTWDHHIQGEDVKPRRVKGFWVYSDTTSMVSQIFEFLYRGFLFCLGPLGFLHNYP